MEARPRKRRRRRRVGCIRRVELEIEMETMKGSVVMDNNFSLEWVGELRERG